ncbi:antiviral RADAR system adenosine triphosphatase RdrA [Pseudoalteromonas sp. SS15]|uniref:antiviral RADAR system adenosine triphosphatase RdrA n=1 Tax=Pseudoalteromonas sp. SS15 TaxID=3139393 RepID=UPI003BA98BC8
MATTYLLDLTKEEYRDDFVSLNEPTDQNHKEFWQYEARDKLVDKLKSFVKDAIAYRNARTENKHKTWLSHNSILINGARGTGKTVFLRNCEAMWQAHCKKSSEDVAGSIHFLQAIDPTMLVDHDNFANVIIAQIYTEVDKVLNNTDCCVSSGNIGEDSKQQFYKKLQKLADSLGKKEEFEGCNGIDKILQYKSGINIESRFHDYVEAALNLLGSSAIALPIDDVDMALDRAYEVVDEVRRLLGCPYIIPIVSGDYSLYEQMVNVHFDEKAYRDKTKDDRLVDKGKEIAKNLTNAYLTKVFPNQMRITLLPVHYIYPTLSFKTTDRPIPPSSDKSQEEKFWLKYSEYEMLLKNEFYPLCKNEEVLKDWPAPEFAREFTQLARTISPDDLIKAKSDKGISYKLWKSYINWAEQKQEGLAYSNVNSYLTLKNRDENQPFNILDLPSFNPIQQVQMAKDYTKWASKKFYASQLKSLNFPHMLRPTDRSKTSNDKWLIENVALLEDRFTEHDRSLSSMPPIEFFNKKSAITLGTVKSAIKGDNTEIAIPQKEKTDSKDTDASQVSCSLSELLISVFIHTDVYSKLKNDYRFVFMSRAFEIITYSFLTVKSDNSIANSLNGILSRRPFYCIFNMSPTKAIEDDTLTESDELEIDKEHFKELGRRERVSAVLSAKITQWQEDNAKLLKQVAPDKLLPIFVYMFNKTFTAFNSFKMDSFFKKETDYHDEHLTDHIKRFELMLVNAAHTAMIEGTAVTANVAITKTQETIRNPERFRNSDRTLTANRTILEDEIPDTNAPQRLFIKALESHPVFNLINDFVKKNECKAFIKLGENKKPKEEKALSKEVLSQELREAVETLLSKTKLGANGVKRKSSFFNRIEESDVSLREKIDQFYTEHLKGKMSRFNLQEVNGDKELNFLIALYQAGYTD